MKKLLAMLCVCGLLVFSSCYSSSHMVGTGGGSGEVVKKKQWYILFGLAPLNNVNSKEMAGGAENYTVTTKFSFLDQIIGAITGFVTIRPMTVEVKK